MSLDAFVHLPSSILDLPPQSESASRSLGAMNPRESHPGSPAPGTVRGTGDPRLDPAEETEMQMKVDFFRKLGYSSDEIHAVLQKLGLQADTNTVLGELVKHGVAADREAGPEEPGETPLVPRGGGPPKAPSPVMPPSEEREGSNLRPVVIDGSNVAMSHGNKEVFSCRGILLAVSWFLERGHSDITVFVPSWRKEQPRPDVPITDQQILRELERKKILVFTPSRRVGGKRVVCYDDRFIVKLAYESDGVVVSNDTYRDLQAERLEWKHFIEERLLMFSFVNDKFMPPDDPLGRHGPSLDNFLRKKPVVPEHKKQPCPYGKKCTYGIKCRYYHPERPSQPQRSVADELRANARLSPPRGPAKEKSRGRPAQRPGEGHPGSPHGSLEAKTPTPKAGAGGTDRPATQGYPAGGSLPANNGTFGAPDRYPPPSPHPDSLSFTSQDQLDSGLGSLESQMSELWSCWPGELLEPAGGSGRPRAPYQLSPSLEPDPHGPPPGYRPYGAEPAHPRPACSFPGYGRPAPGAGTGPYSIPADFPPAPVHPPREYWSEPYPLPPPTPARPRLVARPFGDAGPWAAAAAAADGFSEERASVRVKLCGIFPPHLVEAVMNRFPRLLDPQELAAEILTYKSQHQGL
ncbi:endoribonuclease ZC3H12A [Tachyglossus aculeatus]|uniref:endoribonuclease ZC3H12A n=1 Tax=Tachyglossus aculeatus TaxID=9261 RepID=UPI0018F313C6|nr:endoribonuclease ZC3H12A [Tachyglossus aculeatus]